MKNNNATCPAFSFVEPLVDGGHHIFPGLTKRELFAMAAMQGLRSTGDYSDRHEVARIAVAQADALLAELAK